MKILAFGEILWDIIEGEEHLGGAPFNFAAHSARCGNDAFIVSRLGMDPLGRKAFELCVRHGVISELIQWDDEHPTGAVDVTLTNGQPDYFIRENAAYDFIDTNAAVNGLQKRSFDLFYFGSLAQRNNVSFATLHAMLKMLDVRWVFYDVNLRKSCDPVNMVRNSLGACNVFKLNTDEAPVISNVVCGKSLTHEHLCSTLKELYPNLEIVVITAAENGCYVFDGKNFQHIPGVAVKVKDAIGAGDAFSAGFMHIYSKTGDPLIAGKLANRLGAYVATKRGAVPEYSKEIRELLT